MSIDTLGASMATALATAVLAFRLGADRPATRRPAAGVPSAGRWRPRRAHPAGRPQPAQVADWCDLLARSLRSGCSLMAAVTAAASTDSAMAGIIGPVVQRVSRGDSLVVALDSVGADPVSDVGLVFAVLRSCARFGGPAAAPLERAAATLRARDAVAAEQLAQSAQARLSARVLTLVPLVLLVLLVATDPKVRAAIATPAGVAVVTLGAVLNVCGAMWMRRIIGRPR